MRAVEDQSAPIPGEKRARLDVEIPMFPNETPAIPSGASTAPSHLIREALLPFHFISQRDWFWLHEQMRPSLPPLSSDRLEGMWAEAFDMASAIFQ
jgi:hypothetical protein